MARSTSLIVLGQLNLSFYAVQAQLVKTVLQNIGHEVLLRTGPHETVYPELAAGKVDVFVATWIPHSHSHFWERYKSLITPLGASFTGGESFWAVPSYVPREEVASVMDLGTPDVANRMRKRVQGIGAGTGITTRSQQVVERYGLAALGYHVEAGSDEDWIASITQAYENGEWFVTPLWKPQYLNKKHDFRKLVEPLLCMGGTDTGHITAHNDFVGRAPKRTLDALRKISLGVEAITDLDYSVNVEGFTPEAAARRWIAERPELIEAWLGTE